MEQKSDTEHIFMRGYATMAGFCARKILYAIPLILGVTLISFTLMVYLGPDETYNLLGKNPTAAEIREVRHQLGYDIGFWVRYQKYVVDLAKLEFGSSNSSGERVTAILSHTIPVTLALELPGFVMGNALAIALALLAAWYRGRWQDRLVMAGSVIGMSISFVIVIIAFQAIFCSGFGFNAFPVQGWSTSSLGEYLYYVTVPTLAMVFVTLGYNTRFYRAVFVEEMGRDYVRTARAFGASPSQLLFKYILKNSLISIITRIAFSVPYLLVGGSLLVESFFGIPGVGLVAYQAISSGDQPVLKALVGVTAVLFVMALTAAEICYRMVDPRIE